MLSGHMPRQRGKKRLYDDRRSLDIWFGGLDSRGAEGAENETPKASRGKGNGNGEGLSPSPADLGGLGEHRELFQRGPGQSPPAENEFGAL